ncbi:hypothetical protein PR202_gb15571 [Eleusine coracana subsp. coracana]|uniref:Smr domain-containing protein n=1 Tax=Eleusine coracana subsp. coracana TaxID=191504 RepID=A0AAV5EZT0_ELECO|nr:hypothetical protein PR202_gb15571 [Eleusine coracana subsp. coracana]
MYGQKAPNSGWAAFDRKWRGKDGRGDKTDVSSFPPLSDSSAPMSSSSSVTENSWANPKPFASVVRPSSDIAATGNGSGNKQLSNHVDGVNYGASSASDNKIKQLKNAHGWADSNLIEDILAAVNDDVGQASDLLKAMLPSDVQTGGSKASDQFAAEMNDRNSSVDNRQSDRTHLLPLPTSLSSIPMEPELEEPDDDYLNHRKDALKMMRAATRHSQAASNAFLRGDHAAAKELSLKAQEERAAAEKLNNRAAEEIFRLRNSNNDIWKIDMHGLHASEAVAILERHLLMIEFQPPGTNIELAKCEAVYTESTTDSNIEFATDKVVLLRHKQAILHVITGIGNHSKGQASLPVAVRGFLIENG